MQAFLERLRPIWQPHAGQREFLLHPAKFKVLACGRRWGKTDACAAQIVAALHETAPTRHLILAPTLDQARLLFDRTVELLTALLSNEGRPGPVVRSTPYPRFRHEGHTVLARSGHLGRSLRGNEATHIVVDEAAYVPEELVTEVAMPMLATNNGSITLVSTPHGKNHFWRFYEMGAGGQHGIWSRTAPSCESPYVSRAFLDLQRELVSSRAFAIEYEAQFMDEAGRVFGTDAVERCIVPRLSEPPEGQVCIGVDWARYQDFTAVVALCGWRQSCRLLEIDRFNGLPWKQTVNRVASFVSRYEHSRVLCDATAVGDPLVEALRDQVVSSSVQGVAFTQAVKAAMVDNLAWIVDNGALRMEPHPELLRELQHFEALASPSGGYKHGASSGYHDDLVIALALAARALPKRYQLELYEGERRVFMSAGSR